MAQIGGRHKGASMTGTLVFTDLDDTFVHRENYGFQEAVPAVRWLLDEVNALVVFVTSKTEAEILVLQRELGIEGSPFVAENGAFVAGVNPAYSYNDVCQVLAQAAKSSGATVEGFSSLTAEGLSQLTGLSVEGAGLAKKRRATEPFRLLSGELSLLSAEVTKITGGALTIQRGGKFYSIGPATTKADGVRSLLAEYSPKVSVGLGDAENDLEFLKAVQFPVLINSPHLERVRPHLPQALVTLEHAPGGWAEAIQTLAALGVFGEYLRWDR